MRSSYAWLGGGASVLVALGVLATLRHEAEPLAGPAKATESSPVETASPHKIALGVNASLAGARLFPDDNPWNTPIDYLGVDANSAALIASIALDGQLHPDFGPLHDGQTPGIPYVVVPGAQPKLPVTFDDPSESDQCLYPIPPDAPIEGGAGQTGDRHILSATDRSSLVRRWALGIGR